MTIFFSTKKRHAIVLDPGGDVPVEVGKGQFKYKRMEEIKAVFDDHEFDSEKFVHNNRATLRARDWNVEKVDDAMRNAARFELDYHEVKPPTAEEKLVAAKGLQEQIRALMKEAEKLEPGSTKKMVKKAPIDYRKQNQEKGYTQEKREREYKCKECGFVARNTRGLQVHIQKVHIEEKEEELVNTVLS